VSLGIDPDFVDGKGNRYGEAIVHSAVTPLPVVPGQGEFEVVTLSLQRDDDRDECRMQNAECRMKSNATHSALCIHHSAFSPAGDARTMDMAMLALVDAAAAKRDLAVARGAIDPAVADELFALLVRSHEGAINTTMLLSRTAAAPPPALAVFDALCRNRPVPLGEITRLQVLARAVPGGEADDEVAQLQQRMIALASGKG
jgi:hypothetical protein